MRPTDTARRHSHYLDRHLTNGKLDPATLEPMLGKMLGSEDFQQFADWQAFQTAFDEAGLARQLRVLRRYVMAQIISRDVCRISDLAEVTRTITLFADLPSIPHLNLPTPIMKIFTARPSAATAACRSI